MTWTLKIYNVDGEKAAEITRNGDGNFDLEDFPVENEPNAAVYHARNHEELAGGQLDDGQWTESNGNIVESTYVDATLGLSPKEHLELARDLANQDRDLVDFADVGSVELVDE